MSLDPAGYTCQTCYCNPCKCKPMTPKLSTLTPTDKTKMLAELDGFKLVRFVGEKQVAHGWKTDDDNEQSMIVPDYQSNPDGYRAIIPLVQKFFGKETIDKQDSFIVALGKIIRGNRTYPPLHQIELTIATPLQLGDALLIATRKVEI